MNKTTQCEKVLAYMKVFGSISQREANDIGVCRLASRVCDLRKAGHIVESEKKKVRNRDGSFSRISVYRMGEEHERTL